MKGSATTGLSPGLLDLPLGPVARAALEAIVMVDEQQKIVAVNPAALHMFRCAQADILGQPLSSLIPQVHHAAHAEHVRRFDASGVTERSMSERAPIRGLRRDGQEFAAEATVSRVDMAVHGETRRFFAALLRDLSHEQALQSEVAALRQRFHTLLNIAPIAIWIIENDRVAFANRAAFDLFGVSEGDRLLGQSIYSLLGPESHEALRTQVSLALTGEPSVSKVNSIIVRPDGSMREIEIASAALADGDERAIVQMVIADVTQRRQIEREQELHRRDLRRLSASVVEAREEERRRIARELHDELGQRLTALKMELSSLAPASQRIAEDRRIPDMLEMIDETVAAVRRIAADLRPLMLDDLGLRAAIEWLARDAARRMDIGISVQLGDEEPPVGERAAIALYRIVQEALTNVARHARATEVRIEMRADGNELMLSIRDNGVGFPDRSMRHEGRFGLLGIRERAYMLGGRLEVDNPRSGGGRITVRMPLAPPDPAGAAAMARSPE